MQGSYSAHPAALDACTHFGALYDTDTMTRGGLSNFARVPVALAALVAESGPQVHAVLCCSALYVALQRPLGQSAAARHAKGLYMELYSQGLLWHAKCTSNKSLFGTDRVSSFSLLGASGAPIARLHGLTARLMRSKPSTIPPARTQSRHNGVMFEQQWHAAQPVAGSVGGFSLENRACARRLRLSIRSGSRMEGVSVFSKIQAGAEAALMCAAAVQRVQAGWHNSAWVTRAAQLAGTSARLRFYICLHAFGHKALHATIFQCYLPMQVLRQGGRRQALQARRSGAR